MLVRPGSLSSPLVSTLNLYVKVESGVADLLLIRQYRTFTIKGITYGGRTQSLSVTGLALLRTRLAAIQNTPFNVAFLRNFLDLSTNEPILGARLE